MNATMMQTLYRYDAWATARILDTAAYLTPEQFVAVVGASFPSVRDTLVHTMWAQWNWLARWRGEPNPRRFDPAAYPDCAAVRVHWAEIGDAVQAFVQTLDDAALLRAVEYRDSAGTPHADKLWQLLLHVVNHDTQHRSEVAALLTGFGHSPGDLDFTHYLRTVADPR